MMLFVIVAAILLSSIDGAPLSNLRLTQTGGSLISHKYLSSYDEAKQKCQAEGAVLASPATDVLRRELQALFNNTPHFIGLDARFHQNTFISLEGVPFDEMPVFDLYETLDLDDGECLYMTEHHIRVVQCTARMPFVCYKSDTNGTVNVDDTNVNIRREAEAKGYTYYESTGSSYKIYTQKKTWDDASATCEAESGHLVVIEDENEMQLMQQIYVHHNNEVPHIGIRHFEQDVTWKSVTGKPLSEIFNNWRFEHPSCDNDSSKCYCGVFVSWGRIDDNTCDAHREFICEI